MAARKSSHSNSASVARKELHALLREVGDRLKYVSIQLSSAEARERTRKRQAVPLALLNFSLGLWAAILTSVVTGVPAVADLTSEWTSRLSQSMGFIPNELLPLFIVSLLVLCVIASFVIVRVTDAPHALELASPEASNVAVARAAAKLDTILVERGLWLPSYDEDISQDESIAVSVHPAPNEQVLSDLSEAVDLRWLRFQEHKRRAEREAWAVQWDAHIKRHMPLSLTPTENQLLGLDRVRGRYWAEVQRQDADEISDEVLAHLDQIEQQTRG